MFNRNKYFQFENGGSIFLRNVDTDLPILRHKSLEDQIVDVHRCLNLFHLLMSCV